LRCEESFQLLRGDCPRRWEKVNLKVLKPHGVPRKMFDFTRCQVLAAAIPVFIAAFIIGRSHPEKESVYTILGFPDRYDV
jgi:hypothetical protein